jgi:hypothetical protein
MNNFLMVLTLNAAGLLLLFLMPIPANAQMSKVKTGWVILMENHNFTSTHSGAAIGNPDIKAARKPSTSTTFS